MEASSKRPSHQRLISFAALIAILVLVGISNRIMSLPLARIIELRYCDDYYSKFDPSVIGPGGFIPEHLCKGDEVQKELGWLAGAYETISACIDIVITLPMGYLADRIGARTALLLNTTSTTVVLLWVAAVGYFWETFPINAVLAGPFLAIWGGGECVLKSTTLSLLAEIAEDDAQRTTYLAYVTSVNYIAAFFSPALAGVLMEQGIWIPLWVGVACTLAALPFLSLLPGAGMQTQASTATTPAQSDEIHEAEPLLTDVDGPSVVNTAKVYPVLNPAKDLINGYVSLVRSNKTFRMLLSILFLTGTTSATLGLMIRYISKRYDWTYSEVGYLFTFKAAFNAIVLAVGVPLFTRLMLRRPKTSVAQVDLVGTRATLILSGLGALLIAASPNIAMLVFAMCVYAIGAAEPVFILSLARSEAVGTVTPENEGRAFSLLVLLNELGSVVGTPIVTLIWVKAIDIGGAGLGLPYYISTVAYVVAAIVAGLVRLT